MFYTNVSMLYVHDKTRGTAILVNMHPVIRILNSCNALDIYVLYIAFLFCFPATLRRRLLYIAYGVPYIFILNIGRCVGIAWLNMHHRGLVEITHHYVFTTLLYLMVFYLWVLFTQQSKLMRPKIEFIVSLVAIIIFSWANVVYFGYATRNKFSPLTNQIIHLSALTLTMFIGLYNIRHQSKWWKTVWLGTYGFVFLIVFAVVSIHFFNNGKIERMLLVFAASTRNTFTGPIPFIILFLLGKLYSGRSAATALTAEN